MVNKHAKKGQPMKINKSQFSRFKVYLYENDNSFNQEGTDQ